MGIVHRKEDKYSKEQQANTVSYGAGNGMPKTAMAYINNEPFSIQEGETIISFIRRYFGKDAVPTLWPGENTGRLSHTRDGGLLYLP